MAHSDTDTHKCNVYVYVKSIYIGGHSGVSTSDENCEKKQLQQQ